MPQPSEKREQAPALQEKPTAPQPDREPRPSAAIGLRNWPHSPAHHLRDAGTYIITAGTYKKVAVFKGASRLTVLTNYILELADRYNWSLQAWAVFPNHYHVVGSSQVPESMRSFLRHLHSVTAIEANKSDHAPGRRGWFESKAERSFFQTVSGFRTDKITVPDDFEVPSME